MTRVLVTGATGFVGSQVARLLASRGDEVVALARPGDDTWRLTDVLPRVELVEADLRNVAQVAALAPSPEACIHLAWNAEPGKYLTSPDNLELLHASAHLAAHLAERGCRRFVGVGTCFEYDVEHGRLSESTPLRPAHLYSAAKASLSLLLEHVARGTAMSVAWARLFYLHGPFEDARRLVPAVARSLLQGEPVDTTEGRQVRDYLHVEDAAAALVHIADSDLVGPVNVASGVPVLVRDLVTAIGDQIGRGDLLRIGARPTAPDDPPFVCADIRRLFASGFRPRFDLASGLAHSINWWRGQLAAEAAS